MLGMDDLRGVGCHFTWSNRRSPPIVAKLDRIVINKEWIESFRLSEAHYLPPTTSDHSPCLLRMGLNKRKAGAFKFFDFWRHHPGYGEALLRGWANEYRGLHMFRLCCRLKDLKGELKMLNRNHLFDISKRVDQARLELQVLQQESLLGRPKMDEEKLALNKFNEIARMEESFFKQKARATWLKLGDRNTSYFHGEVNRRANRNAITSLQLPNGERVSEQEPIREEVLKHFEKILTRKDTGCQDVAIVSKLLRCGIKADQQALLTQEVTNREVKETIFNMANGKAPGPDGFTVEFYKSAWKTVFSATDRVSSCIPKDATVQAVFRSNTWKKFVEGDLPEGEEKTFYRILTRLLKPSDYPGEGTDLLIWLRNKKGAFSIKSAWDLLRTKGQRVIWSTWVWSKDIPPRCSFLVWLIAKGKLRTAHFWHQKGLWSSAECVLCQHEVETVDHLFFQCSFVRSVWGHLGSLLHYTFISSTWEDLERLHSSIAGVKGSRRITNAAVVLLYHIWKERSTRRMSTGISSAGSIAVRAFCMLSMLDRRKGWEKIHGQARRGLPGIQA
ncbi:hypothetical protein MLD38_003931 [Melastoma candidum]|uniref:Uncharacterized protein n=1 Tax=Melastoma candidum TaxID=119954 RepID=A0ACB9S401_9MYRT|nr:hypothetical protein MLD38_003931 [Melastoma candidum]